MNIFRHELRTQRKTFWIWSLCLAGTLILFMAFYPSLQDTTLTGQMEASLQNLPQGMLEALGISEIPDFSRIDEYFTYCFPYIILGGCIYALLLGAGTLVREQGSGAIEFLYAKPVTRTDIVLAKGLAALSLVAALTAVCVAASAVSLALWAPEGVSLGALLKQTAPLYVAMLLTQAIYMALGLALSALLNQSEQATPLALGIFFGGYLVGVLSRLIEKAAFLRILSPYAYFEPAKLIREPMAPGWSALGVGLFVLFFLFALLWYRQKDLQTRS